MTASPSRARATALAATILALSVPRDATGQTTTGRQAAALPVHGPSVAAATLEQEHLLLLQLLGCGSALNVTVRHFSVTEINAALSPTQSNRCRELTSTSTIASGISLARASGRTVYNTASATDNPGAVWTGKGLTIDARGGAVAMYGPLSIALRPAVFWSQNQSVPSPTARGFGFPWDSRIDLPTRFGDNAYGRFDAGESWVQVDTRWLAGGISNATQEWGPMHEYPLLLGPNAGGFPHLFAGSGLPWDIKAGRLSARILLGRLDQSAFAPEHEGSTRRLGAGLVASFVPAFLPNVEIGGGRFFHRRWPDEGVDLSTLGVPFEGFLKKRLVKAEFGEVADNQLASVFVRFAFPSSGVEAYGEFLRDDHNYDIRDFFAEPDHESAYAIGLRKVWIDALSRTVTVLTVESANGRITHLSRVRGQSPMYVHDVVIEGHTQRGKLLGSPAVLGGAGNAIVLSRHTVAGVWKGALRAEHVAQNQEGGSWNGRQLGFTALELSRTIYDRKADFTIGGGFRANWDEIQGRNNLSIVLGVRPK